MPPLIAQINQNGQPATTGTAIWPGVTFTFNERINTGNQTSIIQPLVVNPVVGPPVPVPASQPWSPPWVYLPTAAAYFGGDQASLSWFYNNVQQQPFNFCILGTNASQSTVQAYIQNAGNYWFESNISIHETKLSQFWGGAATAGGCYNSANSPLPLDPKTVGDPVCGFPGGYGTMQLDPPSGMPPLWNWQQNVVEGDALLQTIAGPAQDTSNASGVGSDKRAYPFWIRQVKQWLIYNNQQAASNQTPVPAPDAVDPGPPSGYPPSANCNFTVSLNNPIAINGSSPVGTATSPYAGAQQHTYWYGDAVLMKQFNGAPTNYISWNNSTNPNSPVWSFNKANSTSVDIVYEFCSCSTTQGCINQLVQ